MAYREKPRSIIYNGGDDVKLGSLELAANSEIFAFDFVISNALISGN